MTWLRHQFYLLGLYILGAAIPLGGVLLLLAAGLLMFGSITGILVGAFLLSNGIYGLTMSFKSFPLPVGRKLNAENAPGLLEKVEELAISWKGPRAKEVILDPGFWTLDLVGVPTLGVLGWPRFKWLMGVHPMLALSTREFEAVASWELVWWCDQQNWLNLQIKRLAAYWNRLNTALQQGGPAKSPLRERWSKAFLKPYAAWVAARFEPFLVGELVRTDAIVAHQFGGATLVRALCRLALLKPLLDCRAFAEWDRRLKRGEALSETPYAQVSELLGRWPEGADGLLELALDGLVPEAPPLLRLRLEHLEERAMVPVPAVGPTLVKLLEEEGVLQALEAEWGARLSTLVQETRRSREAKDERFLALRPILSAGFPRSFDSKEYLQLAALRLPPEEFLDLADRFLQVHAGDLDARLLVHRARLRLDPETAKRELAQLISDNPFASPAVHELLGEFAREQGHLKEGEAQWILTRRAEAQVEQARKERQSATLQDAFESHGCSLEDVEAIRAYLRGLPQVREAFLVRKQVEQFPEHPVLFLVLRWRRPLWDPWDRRRASLQSEIASECPFPEKQSAFILLTTRGHLRRHRKRLRELEASILPP